MTPHPRPDRGRPVRPTRLRRAKRRQDAADVTPIEPTSATRAAAEGPLSLAVAGFWGRTR
jgi:hypothetical protein